MVGWASGVISEEKDARYTSVGTRTETRFVANYVDKFGMPKSDALGGFNPLAPNSGGMEAPPPLPLLILGGSRNRSRRGSAAAGSAGHRAAALR